MVLQSGISMTRIIPYPPWVETTPPPHIPGIIRVGAVDQRTNEGRQDVLVFTSAPLQEDTEVTGPVVVRLHAASSATDTDFIARLIDVYPDGTAYNLTEGIIRARFRESIWEAPKLLVPGKIYEYTIELLPTSNVFLKGHSIRVHLTSSNFPLWDRNPNTAPRTRHRCRGGRSGANYLLQREVSIPHPFARDTRRAALEPGCWC